MKKLLKLLFVLSLLVLVACSSSTYQVEPMDIEDLGSSGVMTYRDRQLELKELIEKHKDKYIKGVPNKKKPAKITKFIKALNKEYGQEFFESREVVRGGSSDPFYDVYVDYTLAGYQYFTGIDSEAIREWSYDETPYWETIDYTDHIVDPIDGRSFVFSNRKIGGYFNQYSHYIASDYLDPQHYSTWEVWWEYLWSILDLPLPVAGDRGAHVANAIRDNIKEELLQELPNFFTEEEWEVFELPTFLSDVDIEFYNADRDYIAQVWLGDKRPSGSGLLIIIKKDESGFEVLDKRLEAPELVPNS